MNFHSFLNARRRGVILCALADAAYDTEVASDLMHRYCLAVGLRPTLEAVDADLRWLAERRVVLLSEPGDGLLLAKITQHGREVVTRRATLAGCDIPATPEG